MQIHFKEFGTGQPLVILHGLFGSGDNWTTFAKAFSEHYKVYLLDARNHGRSPHSDLFNYSAMANDLSAFLREQNIENPILLGHSMGGKTLMKFAVRTKTPVKKLIIVDIAPRYYKPHHQKYLEGLFAVPLNKIESRTEAEKIMEGIIPEMDVRQFLLKSLYRTEEGSFAWRFNLDVIASQIENIGEELNDTYSSEIPTLFIRGENSNYIQDKDTDSIHTIFKNVKIQTIPNAGHWVHAEQPELFIQAIKDFI